MPLKKNVGNEFIDFHLKPMYQIIKLCDLILLYYKECLTIVSENVAI